MILLAFASGALLVPPAVSLQQKDSGKSGLGDSWRRHLHLNFGLKNGLRGIQIGDKFLYSDMDFHLIFTVCFQKELSVCLFN